MMPGDVRAVADVVAGAGRARVGDHVGRDARAAVGVLEVRHVAADAGVDDGDADALAGDAGGPQLVRADGLRVGRRQAAAVDAGAVHARVEREVEDVPAAPQRPRLAGGEPDGEAVDGGSRPSRGRGGSARARGPCARTTPGLNWAIATTLRSGCFLATEREARVRDGAAWAADPLAASGTTAASRTATVRPRQRRLIDLSILRTSSPTRKQSKATNATCGLSSSAATGPSMSDRGQSGAHTRPPVWPDRTEGLRRCIGSRCGAGAARSSRGHGRRFQHQRGEGRQPLVDFTSGSVCNAGHPPRMGSSRRSTHPGVGGSSYELRHARDRRQPRARSWPTPIVLTTI